MSTEQITPDTNDEKIVHEYDGILEADNHLPRWWLFTLYTAIGFAVFYWIAYETLRVFPSPTAAFAIEQAKAAEVEAAKLKAMGAANDENLMAMAKNEAVKAEGKEVFLKNCLSCHGPTGGGGIGPNLTDGHWIHGGKPIQIYTTVKEGFTKNGMPAWVTLIGEERVRVATAFVLSIKGTNVPGGKAPQGVLEQ